MADIVGTQDRNAIYSYSERLDPSKDIYKHTTWEGLGAVFNQSFRESPGAVINKRLDYFEAIGMTDEDGDPISIGDQDLDVTINREGSFWYPLNKLWDPDAEPSKITVDGLNRTNPILERKDWERSKYFRPELKYEKMTPQQAKLLADWKDDENRLKEIIENSPRSLPLDLVAGFAGQAADPMNLILAGMSPGLGATMFGAKNAATKILSSSVAAGLENAAIEPIVMSGLMQEQYDMTQYNALANILAGVGLGGMFSAGGQIFKRIFNPSVSKAAAVNSTNNLAAGGRVDTGRVVRKNFDVPGARVEPDRQPQVVKDRVSEGQGHMTEADFEDWSKSMYEKDDDFYDGFNDMAEDFRYEVDQDGELIRVERAEPEPGTTSSDPMINKVYEEKVQADRIPAEDRLENIEQWQQYDERFKAEDSYLKEIGTEIMQRCK